MVQIQNNFTEMFLMMPSINIDDNMATRAKNKKKIFEWYLFSH